MNTNKIKVLLITQFIPHYRIPIYNKLNNQLNFTVLHSQNELNQQKCEFSNKYIKCCSIGPFYYFKINLNKFCNNFDVVIYENNIRFIDRVFLTFLSGKKYKWISWGIGLAASYKKRLGDKDWIENIRLFLQNKCDANILYSSYPLNKYIRYGINKNKIFVANNTVLLEKVSKPTLKKNSVLFVGTLYKEKKLKELIDAYKIASLKCTLKIPLIIVGEGHERNNLEQHVASLKLETLIKFKGKIENDNELAKYFGNALACISPGQAGLSVLNSMANSVPFVTKKNAITGGEIFNINFNGNKTGVLYETEDELIELICDINRNKERYIEMGINARKYYEDYCSPKQMIQSFMDAILYAIAIK